MNRRFYRQGRNYRVANATIHDSSGDAFIKFCTAPNTWTTYRAWQLGLKHWMQMHQDQIGDGWHKIKGKYFDYKVYLTEDMVDDSDKPHHKDCENSQIQFGDWDYSIYQSPAGTTTSDPFYAYLMGDHTGSSGVRDGVSLLQCLDEMIHQPTEEPTLDADIENAVFWNLSNDGTVSDDLIDDLEDFNDMTPYFRYTVPGGDDGANENAENPWVARETALNSDTASIAYVGGFDVPCGLLCIETNCGADNTIEVLLELAPGNYKGLHAPTMGTPRLKNDKKWTCS